MSGGDWPERVAGEVRAIMGACPGWEVWWRPGRFEAGGGYWARRDGQTLHASNRVTLVGLVRWAESKDGP